jgi:hypothetical protein
MAEKKQTDNSRSLTVVHKIPQRQQNNTNNSSNKTSNQQLKNNDSTNHPSNNQNSPKRENESKQTKPCSHEPNVTLQVTQRNASQAHFPCVC